jgi:chromosome segregation ATPase
MTKASEPIGFEERAVAEVDRIRDIIFGQQMRSYEQQFKRFTNQLDQLGRQLEDLRAELERQRADQEARTIGVQEELSQQHSRLETSLTQQTAQSRTEFRQAVDQTRSDLSRRLEQLGAELRAQTGQLGIDLRKQGQELHGQFTAALEALEHDKASREHVGDLLVEMGTRLKEQKGLADLLGQLAGTPAPPSE